jgi:hypothetical protein
MIGGRSLMILALLLVGATADAAALATDERGRERVRGDDDPIVVPASVLIPEKSTSPFYDPETTGSVEKRRARAHSTCDRLAFYPDKPAEDEFRDAC